MIQERKRQLVSSREMLDVGSHLRKQGTYYVAGSNSIWVPSQKTKYIDKSVCKPWPDLENVRVYMTPGEAARTELKREFADLRRVGWSPPMVNLFDKRVPIFYGGATKGEMTYIDMKGAYCQLYRLMWLDTPYPCGLYGRFPLIGVADRLEPWKAARNAIVGIARSRHATGIRGDKRIQLSVMNKYLSPGLWATIVDVLHWVADKALQCGAVYINTDGYLFHNQLSDIGEFTLWLAKQSIRFEIRASGDAEVRSWNNYRVGRYQTQAYRLNLFHKTRSFNNVKKQKYKWESYLRRCNRIVRHRDSRVIQD